MEHGRGKDAADELDDHRQDQADQSKTHHSGERLANGIAHATANDRGNHEGDSGGQCGGADCTHTRNGSRQSHETTQGETGDQAVDRQQRQGCGVVALQGDVLRHEEQHQVADHSHPEQGHEQRCGHHRETTNHPD